jgi:P-type Cu2+ transporter
MDIMIKVYPVTGLHCANCAINVEKTLKKQPGIADASVNFADSTARIEYDTKEASDALALQSAVRSIGYDLIVEEEPTAKVAEDEQARYKILRAKTVFSIILSVPVIVISMVFMNMPYANLILLALTLPVLLWPGSGFFVNAFKQARHGSANMDTLVAMSTGIAFLFSVFNTFFPHFWHARGLHPHVYYEAAAAVIAFILAGKLLEERAKAGTSSAIKKLMGMQASTVIRIYDKEKEAVISISQVKHGDTIRVRPGDRIPVDGEILSGNSSVDESSMTGESFPAERGPGEKVYAGTINLNGSFLLTAHQVGSETMLSRIIDTVRQAQGSKAPVQKTVDRIAGIFVPVVIGISVLSFAIWMIFGGNNALSHALLAMVTVLVIACPCALGLATPTAIMVGMGKGAQNGILIRDAESLETIHRINAIVLDKTGTITEGRPVVKEIQWTIPLKEQQEAAMILKGLEKHSSHPLAEAVTRHLSSVSSLSDSGSEFENLPGLGVRGVFGNKTYFAGNLKLMEEQGIVLPTVKDGKMNKERRSAQSRIYFADGSALVAVIDLADQIKETAAGAIGELQKMGIEVHMLTGDNVQTALEVAEATGITSFTANLLPSGKSEYVRKLQDENKIVAMAGDGINDSQALVQANVSIAMGKGSDIAMDVAGMTLISSDLRQIAKAIRLSRLTVKTINQNLFWAFIYNLIGIPIAAGILYPLWGFMLNPMIAAAAMAMSSVSVVSNSLRLRRSKI